jgi:hypothetical protein
MKLTETIFDPITLKALIAEAEKNENYYRQRYRDEEDGGYEIDADLANDWYHTKHWLQGKVK